MKTIGLLLFLLSLPFSVLAHTEEATVIHITDTGFEPEAVTIVEGGTVLFENVRKGRHWPASNIHPTHTAYPGSNIKKCDTEEASLIFDACRPLLTGEVYSFTFTKEGRWRYHDHEDPSLTGVIIVEDNPNFEEDRDGWSLVKWLSEILESIQYGLLRTYYALFPSALESRLGGERMFEIAHDDERLRKIVAIAGPSVVMDRILKESEGGTALDCHQEAHQVGRVSYEVFGADVFSKADASCHSGFYHGMMEALLTHEGTADLASRVHTLCNSLDTDFGIYSCLHGVGHGVMAYENYDLSQALSICERFPDDFSESSCFGGVFMENIITAQGFGAVPGHQTQWVREHDYHFPCSIVADDYQQGYECYQMQTSWMLTLSDFDWARVSYECSRAPKSLQFACFTSFGRDIAGAVHRDPQRILELCELAPKDGVAYDGCVYGAVNVVVEFWGPEVQDQGEEFCALVSEAGARERCFDTTSTRKAQILNEH